MLSASKIIGFVPTKDSQKARGFYEGKLGFQFVSDDPFALVVQAGETMIRVVKAQDFTPAPYTVMGWEVSDIEAVVGWLQARGVAMENIRSSRIAIGGSGRHQPATKLPGSRIPMETCFPSASTFSSLSLSRHSLCRHPKLARDLVCRVSELSRQWRRARQILRD